jgi:Fic family protein
VQPPYIINAKIIKLIAAIEKLLGKLEAYDLSKKSNVELRRKNRIKTIHGSLSIEGNTLSIEQITAILNGKKIIAPKREITEVKNAIEAYALIDHYKANLQKSLLEAHKKLMTGLVENPGQYRKGNVGIFKNSKVVHIAPQAKMLVKLMDNLFAYLSKTEDHPLISSSVFHYEFEFIHPFADGNGRLGRLWQTVILYNYNSLFEFLPIESIIKKNQKSYYSVLESCDKKGNSTLFIEFILGIILESLEEYFNEFKPDEINDLDRLNLAKEHFKIKEFSRKEYLNLFKTISSATASRDLLKGLNKKLLKKIGANNQSRYKFK